MEVSSKDGGFARVERVICVVDCGPVVHPDNVVAQMEGSIIDGLSAALHGQVVIRAGRVATGNFNDYPQPPTLRSPGIAGLSTYSIPAADVPVLFCGLRKRSTHRYQGTAAARRHRKVPSGFPPGSRIP